MDPVYQLVLNSDGRQPMTGQVQHAIFAPANVLKWYIFFKRSEVFLG
jgi:hypothetical protein